jgi:hypothetical protein
MTQARKLKKSIRARSTKTGESYTAARRHVLAARTRRSSVVPDPLMRASRTDPAAKDTPATPSTPKRRTTLGSVSDKTAREKTGRGLEHWFAVLDAFGAPQKGHTASANHLYEDHGVPGWYCQGITVAYERMRGLRSTNQSCDGGFQVSVSRVVPASVGAVRDAVRSPEHRTAWLADSDPELVRTLRAALQAEKAKTFVVREKGDARLRFKWGKGTVEIRIDPRPNGKASIVADNTDLPGPEAVESRRAAWTQALDGLRGYLSR